MRVEADPGKRYRLGGGAVSTAGDYFRFAQMLVNGGALDGVRCLSRKTVEYMLADHIPGFPGSTPGATGPGYGFGLGFAVRRQEGFAVVPGSIGEFACRCEAASSSASPCCNTVYTVVSQGAMIEAMLARMAS
jgi:CubicO group peptidase (beta-lactamase class C family)